MLFKGAVDNKLDSSLWQPNPVRIPSLPKQQDTSAFLFMSLFILLIMFHYFIKENISDCLVSRLVYDLWVWVSWEKKCLEENQSFVD